MEKIETVIAGFDLSYDDLKGLCGEAVSDKGYINQQNMGPNQQDEGEKHFL